MIKFALIKERKTPPDRRVVFSPEKLKEVAQAFPDASFKIERSDIRIFPDEAYEEAGFEVSDDVSDCDVMLGVKEVPVDALIPEKKYFFFSHTIKQQPYNRELLRHILRNNIELYDHEVLTNKSGLRLVGFGRYAGIVGAYNGIRAVGLDLGTFELPKVESLPDYDHLLKEIKKAVLPPIKIVLTGRGKVAQGAMEVLDHLGIQRVGKSDFLKKDFQRPVYCQIVVMDYTRRKDGGKTVLSDFYSNPQNYESNFGRFAQESDMFIAGHFYGEGAPPFFTAEDARKRDFRIKYVADISCDINGPVASTIRASTIADPIYGYDPETGLECDFKQDGAIVVMAVDNLPCELPKDASEGFGDMFMKNVLPAFFNGDKNGVLERARMTSGGKLTPRFSYLQDFVDGK